MDVDPQTLENPPQRRTPNLLNTRQNQRKKVANETRNKFNYVQKLNEFARIVCRRSCLTNMYIRFVVGLENEHHRDLTGIIAEAQFLIERGELEPYEVKILEEIFEWLNENLPCPRFSSNNWPSDVVSWFKPEAEEPIQKMWEIVALLKEHDVPVRVLKSKMPGRAFYEDNFQIVVLEKKVL